MHAKRYHKRNCGLVSFADFQISAQKFDSKLKCVIVCFQMIISMNVEDFASDHECNCNLSDISFDGS